MEYVKENGDKVNVKGLTVTVELGDKTMSKINEIRREIARVAEENAKLHELLGEAAKMYEMGEVDCGICDRYERCYAGEATDYSPAKCEFLSLVRELGVEVPE